MYQGKGAPNPQFLLQAHTSGFMHGCMLIQEYSQLVSIDNNVLLWPCSEVNNQRNDDRNYRDCCKDKIK